LATVANFPNGEYDRPHIGFKFFQSLHLLLRVES